MSDENRDLLPPWVVAILREPASISPTARSAIMNQVRQLPKPRLLALPPRTHGWMRRGLLTPAGSALVSGMLALAVVLRIGTPVSFAPETAGSAEVVGDTVIPRTQGQMGFKDTLLDTLRIVEFVFRAPNARSVAVVGNFNGWRAGATPMQSASGTWRARVAVPRDVLRFSYIVNGDEVVPAPSLPMDSSTGRQHSI